MTNTLSTEPTNTTTHAIRDPTEWSRFTTAQRIKHLEIEIDFDIPNRPSIMQTEAPGINPSRRSV